MKLFIIMGCINMFLGIALGAFGAHGLEGKISERMISNWQTGAQYHMIHAIGLFAVGLLLDRLGSPSLVTTGGWLLVAGILLFSGSLYLMALTGITKLGAITPIGGISFLAGWACIAFAVAKQI